MPSVELFDRLFSQLPTGYTERLLRLEQIRMDFQNHLASAIQPALNEHYSRLPRETLDDCKHLAKTMNYDLRRLGLALQDPVLRIPAILVAHSQDALHPHKTRFRFVVRDPVTHKLRMSTQPGFPEFVLIPDRVHAAFLSYGGRCTSTSRER